jgi:uncharacterized protein
MGPIIRAPWRPMSDLVNCERLAEEAAVLERTYELGKLPRLRDLLAQPDGSVHARFVFTKLASGRPGADVSVSATPHLVCQRCMQGFPRATESQSAVEFAADDIAQDAASEREFCRLENGLVSLSELAEEELLLALPIAPMCDSPSTCGRAPSYAKGNDAPDVAGDLRRPFGALQDLLKKT